MANFDGGKDNVVRPEKPVDVLAKKFAAELKTGVKPEARTILDETGYQLFAEQNGIMIYESQVGRPIVPKVETLDDYTGKLINSILNSQPESTRNMVYAETQLRENGVQARDVHLALLKAVDNLTADRCAEVSKQDLKQYIKNLRDHFFQGLKGKMNITIDEPVAVKNVEVLEKAVVEKANDYIYTRSRSGESGRIGIVDFVDDKKNGVEAFCCAAFDTKVDQGEDSVGFFKVGNKVVLIEADGVGSSFMGSYASQGAVETIVQTGSDNLSQNARMAGERLKQMHRSFQVPLEITGMHRDVLEKKKNEGGSQTMLNQISVDTNTGMVDGCFMGDGGFTVLRNDGTVQSYDCAIDSNHHGDSNIRLSTLKGLMGTPANIKDITRGELVLGSGDILMLYSDGVTKNMVIALDLINKNGGNFRNEVPRMIAELENSDEKNDDRSLVMFRME